MPSFAGCQGAEKSTPGYSPEGTDAAWDKHLQDYQRLQGHLFTGQGTFKMNFEGCVGVCQK